MPQFDTAVGAQAREVACERCLRDRPERNEKSCISSGSTPTAPATPSASTGNVAAYKVIHSIRTGTERNFATLVLSDIRSRKCQARSHS